MPHQLDTDTHVYFYEHEFYVLSNFSAFRLQWREVDFDTSEHAYQFEKFYVPHPYWALVDIQRAIVQARSAHEARKIAERHARFQRPEWDTQRLAVMRDILRAKIDQHAYVHRKLLETGERVLVQDSWRDAYWGIGDDGTGANMLGKLWMEIRAELCKEGPLDDPVYLV